MKELKRYVEDIQNAFSDDSYPRDFLAAYDLMECLASHSGRETFLVRKKGSGGRAVAKCYDRAAFSFHPHPELLQGVDHPGLPRYLEQFENEKVLCVVREYIEGEPLSDYARDRQMTIPQILSFCGQLCDILSVLHGMKPPVIHRDIKPENIIVRPDGAIALIDFDIARAVREDVGEDTAFFGTKGYAPPEQYGFRQTDARSDIFAFGVLLRWMITGSTRENRNISMDPALRRIIDRCTAFAPEERYENIGQVKAALEEAGEKKRQANPLKLAALMLGALLLLAAGFGIGRYTEWLKPAERIIFREPLIERAARLWIGKESGNLTKEDLAQVTRLYIFGTEAFGEPDPFYQRDVGSSAIGPIRTLDDLAMLPNLEEVHIAHQGYVDASGVAGHTELHTVEFKHMRLSGAAAIADVPALRHAILFCDRLTDVTVLQKCPLLETLDIGLNDLTSLEQVGSHPKVKSLGFMWLEMDNVEDIARRLPDVEAVTLQHGTIRDPSGLKALPRLRHVYVLQEQEAEYRALFEGTDVEIHVTEN